MPKLIHLLREYLTNDFSAVEDVFALNIIADFDKDTLKDMGDDFSPKIKQRFKSTADRLERELKPFLKRRLPDGLAKKVEEVWYDGSDAYDSIEFQEKNLPRIYQIQIKLIEELIKLLKSTKD